MCVCVVLTCLFGHADVECLQSLAIRSVLFCIVCCFVIFVEDVNRWPYNGGIL